MPDKNLYGLAPEVMVTAVGHLRIVTLNRPEHRNGINRVMHQSLARLWQDLADDDDVRAVVLTGAGECFSAGGDFDYMQENIDDAEMRSQTISETRAIITGMVRCPVPVIAAVNGPAVGLGCSLAVLSDIVLLAEGSFLADPHLRMGLVPGDGGLALPALVGLGRAKEYLFLGERIPAERAVQVGIASRVVTAVDLLTEAIALAERLAAVPPAALQDTKRALNGYLDYQLDRAFESAVQAELRSMHSGEHREAVAGAKARSAR